MNNHVDASGKHHRNDSDITSLLSQSEHRDCFLTRIKGPPGMMRTQGNMLSLGHRQEFKYLRKTSGLDCFKGNLLLTTNEAKWLAMINSDTS